MVQRRRRRQRVSLREAEDSTALAAVLLLGAGKRVGTKVRGTKSPNTRGDGQLIRIFLLFFFATLLECM